MNKYHFLKLFLLIGVLFWSDGLAAQKVTFTAKGPKVVGAGQRFRFSYSVNAKGSNFRPGNMEGFQVLSGPGTSQNTSMQMINGKVTQRITITYNYVLQAEKEGKFTIAPAKITVDGKEYTSNALTIEVIKGQQPSANNNGRSNPPANTQAATVSNDDLFLRMLVSKREVMRGEPIVATLKMYSNVNLANLGNFKAPDYNGFWSETLKQAQNLDFQKENVNGKIMSAAVVQQHVLIPERTGTLTIEPAELTAVAQVPVQRRRSRSMFDQIFGGRQNVQKVLASARVEIKVNDLPFGAPAGYKGAVGDLRLNATLEPQETKTNEPISLKITYSGTGNLKLIPEPAIKFPTDFEVYDPKVSNNYSAGASGYSGSKTYEYLLIPRVAGDFEIPAVGFSVFDLKSKQYKNLSAGPFPVHVEKGEGGDFTAIDPGLLKEDVQVLGSDIRFIKTDEVSLRQKDRPFFGSASFYLSYLSALGLFAFGLVMMRRQRQRSEDVVFMKNKKAGQVAQRRLKQAKSYLDQGERNGFYKAILDAMWGYLSDKLNISQGKLNKEKTQQALAEKGIDTDLVDGLSGLLGRCEFAQFAPGGGEGELAGVYDEAADLIGKLEEAFKQVIKSKER
ncbi:MAG: BatD family protein [Bacteroidota bacterium]